MVIWITGLSGAGKSSIAKSLVEEIKQKQSVVLLDGDMVRIAISDPHIGYDKKSRIENAYRISRLAKMLSDQEIIVVVATMSLFHEIHEWNRKNFSQYLEVYVSVDFNVLKKRDARSIYSKAEAGITSDVVGVHLEFEEPKCPHVIIDNSENKDSFSSFVHTILEKANLVL